MFHRLRRILFHAAAAGAALLLLAVLAFWPLSYFRYDRVAYRGPDGGYSVFSWAGRLGVSTGNYPYARGEFSHANFESDAARAWEAWSYMTSGVEATPGFRTRRFLGGEYRVTVPGNTFYPAHIILVPYSSLAILLTFVPAIWLLTRKRRRRHDRLAKGLCLECGYDLRAHRPGAKCSECGTATPNMTETKA